MSPFAEAVRALRVTRGLRQEDLADALACDRGRISAIENDQREVIPEEFVLRIAETLKLSAAERANLMEAVRTSQRSYVIAPEAPAKSYELVRALFDRLERMPEAQLDALIGILRSFESITLPDPSPAHRVWRKDKLWRSDPDP